MNKSDIFFICAMFLFAVMFGYALRMAQVDDRLATLTIIEKRQAIKKQNAEIERLLFNEITSKPKSNSTIELGIIPQKNCGE